VLAKKRLAYEGRVPQLRRFEQLTLEFLALER
jgi:hypothetical protein